MPVLSCGGMRYQFRWQDQPLSSIPPDNQRNLEATVERAVALGINHIETARGYGSSERQLGPLIERLPRGEIILQSKIAPNADPETFVREFHESLERLRVDHLDLLALHGVNDRQTLEWSLRPGGCFDAAQTLRKQGKVRFIGFSTHASLDVILDGIRHTTAEAPRGFDYVNLHYYFIFQRNWPAIVEATARDMGVFIISPTDKGGKLYAPPPKLVDLCKPLSPIAFNDLFCLARPEVHTLSIGAARPSDFDEHIRALEWLSRASEVLAPIEQRLRAAMAEAIGSPDPEAITEGLPEWSEAPGQLNLRVMLWLRNLALGWDLVDYGKMRFNLLGSGDNWFPGGSPKLLSEIDPVELRRAVAGSAFAKQIPELLAESVELLGGEAVKRLSRSG